MAENKAMTKRPTKICTDCGSEFEQSPCDKTIRCPDCRALRAGKTSSNRIQAEADALYIEMGKIRQEAHAARAAGDTETYDRLIPAFRQLNDRRSELLRQS